MTSSDRDHILRVREEANRIKQDRERSARRKRGLAQLAIVCSVALVLIALVGLSIYGPSWFRQDKIVEASGSIILPTADGESIERAVSITQSGGIAVGDPEAPITIDYYYDYACPHCAEYHEATSDAYKEIVSEGTALVVYHPINFTSPFGLEVGAALAAATIHEPQEFYKVHDGLFATEPSIQVGWEGAQYAERLATLGIESAEALDETSAGAYVNWMRTNTVTAKTAGVVGTPTVIMNDVVQDTPPSATELRALIK